MITHLKYILFLIIISFSSLTKADNNSLVHTCEVYKSVDTLDLNIDIFQLKECEKDELYTAIVFFHGGGWAYGAPDKFFTTCERYAERGIICFSVEYRLSNNNGTVPHPSITPIESLMDAKSAIRWVRQNAQRFNINPEKIIAAGQSAGGHLAISTAAIDKFNENTDDLTISCIPNAVMSFSGTVNTMEAWCDRLLGNRRQLIWDISPVHNLKSGLPPMIQFHSVDDATVPFWTIQFFKRKSEELGNYCELHQFEGKKHYLGKGNPKYAEYFDDDILEIADQFLINQGFINEKDW